MAWGRAHFPLLSVVRLVAEFPGLCRQALKAHGFAGLCRQAHGFPGLCRQAQKAHGFLDPVSYTHLTLPTMRRV